METHDTLVYWLGEYVQAEEQRLRREMDRQLWGEEL